VKLGILAIAVVALAIAAGAIVRELDATTAPRSGDDRAEPPSRGRAASTAAPQLARTVRAAEPVASPRAPVTDADGPAPTPADVRDRLEDAFRGQAIDPVWSRTAVQTLDRKLATVLPARSAVRSVECRGALCRIETSHAGRDEYREFVHRAFVRSETELWNAGFFTNVVAEPGVGQPLVTVAYLAREGQGLPPPEQLLGAR
jgi:hypothetical protein